MNDSELRKWLEACRDENDLQLPESAPLVEALARDPELRPAWQRLRRADEAIRAALHDVAVPAGLEQQILARLEAARHTETKSSRGGAAEVLGELAATATAEEIVEESAEQAGLSPAADRSLGSEPSGSPETHGARGPRSRLWLTGIAAIAASVVGLLLLRPWSIGEPPIGDEREAVLGWIEQLDAAGWIEGVPPADQFPLPAELAVRPARWQSLQLGRSSPAVVCCEIRTLDSPALLFVVRGKPRPGLAASPPATPYPLHRSWQVASWATPHAVYVLALSGSAPRHQYDQLLQRRTRWASFRCLSARFS